MRVLLASSPHADTFGYSMPPPGLLRLGGALERAGHEAVLEDLAFRQASGAVRGDDALCSDAAELLLAHGPVDLLGLSVMGATLPAALRIAEHYAAARPGTPILIGGPGTTGTDQLLLERFPAVTAVVRGEGEVTLLRVLERLGAGRGLAGVAGVTHRAAGSIQREGDREQLRDLNELPAPAWHLVPPLSAYKAVTGEAEGLVPVDSGRGCSYDCSFCTIGRYWGRRSRPLPAERLAAEVREATSLPAARHAYLCHDLFGADRRHALAFCDALLAGGEPPPWECRARIDHLDEELLGRMAAAGCYRVLLGVESADPGVRRANQKGMREDLDALAVVDACARVGITPILSFIVGLPGEDEAALARTLDLAADAALRAGVNLSFHLVNPQPGCGLGERFEGRTQRVEDLPPDMAFGAGDTGPERELIAAHPDLFTTWHQLPHPEPALRDLKRIALELPEVLHRFPRGFALARRRRALDALELFRDWKRDGRSFQAYLRAQRDPLLDDVLRWEEAQIRQGAAGPRASAPLTGDSRPLAAGELLSVSHDLSALRPEALVPPGQPTHLVVQPAPRALAGTRTLKVSPDVARVLAALRGEHSLADLEARHPGIRTTLERLHGAGLVTSTTP